MPESRLGVHHEFDWNFNIPEYRAPDSTARKNEAVSLPKTCPSIGVWIVTSQQELAIWQPAWPTVGNDHVSAFIEENISILTSRIDGRC